jgi:hypothetical protein
MDFIVRLPKFRNNLVITVIVDSISKYDHFYSLQYPFTTSTMDQVSMDNIFKLHVVPHSIVSNKDPTFTKTYYHTTTHMTHFEAIFEQNPPSFYNTYEVS